MARYTITPWRTPSDLLSARAQLYNLRPEAQATQGQRHAVDRILLAWKLRSNVPHAVESTALLVDAQLHHSTATATTGSPAGEQIGNSNFSIRATYTAAFTRFVTGFCDIGRAREGTLAPSSMLEIARQIDMPAHFVTLRHEATHEELPSLQRLVAATREALEWLWRVYWSRLEEPQLVRLPEANGNAVGVVAEEKEEARRILRGYRTVRRQAFKSSTQRTAEHRAQLQDFASACVGFCSASGGVESLASVVVQDKFLIPSNHELGAPIAGALTLWCDLFILIMEEQSTFIMALAKQLVLALHESPTVSTKEHWADEDKDAVFLWLRHILTWRSTLPEPVLAGVRAETMKMCCLYPGPWTQKVGAQLLKTSDESFREEWEALFEASGLQDIEDSDAAAERDTAQDDMEVDQRVWEATRCSEKEHNASGGIGWRRAAITPQGLPIGVVE